MTGVTWHKNSGVYYARIVIRGEELGLGQFDNEISAALAFDQAALKHRKDTRLNFPDGPPPGYELGVDAAAGRRAAGAAGLS